MWIKKKELKLYLRTALGTSLNFHCVYSFSPQIQELQIQFYLASLLIEMCKYIYMEKESDVSTEWIPIWNSSLQKSGALPYFLI